MMNRIVAARSAAQYHSHSTTAPSSFRARSTWPHLHQVTLDFGRLGKPTDHALVESFNGRLRDECLNTNWFLSLEDAKRKLETWRKH